MLFGIVSYNLNKMLGCNNFISHIMFSKKLVTQINKELIEENKSIYLIKFRFMKLILIISCCVFYFNPFNDVCPSKVSFSDVFQTSNLPQVCFKGIRGDAILELKNAKTGVALGAMLGEEMLPVIGFEMTIISNSKSVSSSSKTNNFTSQQKTDISKIKSGSKIIFDKVMVKMKDGRIMVIAHGTYTVK